MSFWCSKPTFCEADLLKKMFGIFVEKHVFVQKHKSFSKRFCLRTHFLFLTLKHRFRLPSCSFFMFFEKIVAFWADSLRESFQRKVFFFCKTSHFSNHCVDFLPEIWTSKWGYLGVSCFYHDLCVLWGSSQFIFFVDFSKYPCGERSHNWFLCVIRRMELEIACSQGFRVRWCAPKLHG